MLTLSLAVMTLRMLEANSLAHQSWGCDPHRCFSSSVRSDQIGRFIIRRRSGGAGIISSRAFLFESGARGFNRVVVSASACQPANFANFTEHALAISENVDLAAFVVVPTHRDFLQSQT